MFVGAGAGAGGLQRLVENQVLELPETQDVYVVAVDAFWTV
jgi:hypothetical protein